jgi:hypothetical protein
MIIAAADAIGGDAIGGGLGTLIEGGLGTLIAGRVRPAPATA